jgi:hypothetical protein
MGLNRIDVRCLHRRRKPNVGDLACSPGAYFDLGHTTFHDLSEEIPTCDLAVMGGGQVFQDCVDAAIYRTTGARRRVVWGVGISKKDRAGIAFDVLAGSCDLISTRNWGVPGCDYVPCASAMSDLFDAPPEPEVDVALFLHAKKSASLEGAEGVPQMTNHGGTMRDAIAFLARAETVVTNSYHGTYWAMCLGRKVLCLPFNAKFHGFRDAPVMSTPEDWRADLGRAEARLGTLEEARARNLSFYEKTRNLA